jgi:hypothetical protein
MVAKRKERHMPISARQLVELQKLALAHPFDENRWQKLLDSGVLADAMKADLDVTDRAKRRLGLGLTAHPEHTTIKRAREILVPEMITHEDVDALFADTNLQMSEEEFVQFKAGVPWNGNMLGKGYQNRYLLLPMRALSVADLNKCFPAYFSTSSIERYGNEKFFTTKLEKLTWLFIRQDDVADMRHRTWDEQVTLCPSMCRLPTAYEMIYAALISELVGRSTLITPGRTIRCIDMTSQGRNVLIGQSAENRQIIIGSAEPIERSGGISTTVCMKPLE